MNKQLNLEKIIDLNLLNNIKKREEMKEEKKHTIILKLMANIICIMVSFLPLTYGMILIELIFPTEGGEIFRMFKVFAIIVALLIIGFGILLAVIAFILLKKMELPNKVYKKILFTEQLIYIVFFIARVILREQ